MGIGFADLTGFVGCVELLLVELAQYGILIFGSFWLPEFCVFCLLFECER